MHRLMTAAVASVVLALGSSVAQGHMHGLYEIKPDGSGDFQYLNEACTALETIGMSGDCTFELYDDSSLGQAHLDSAPGNESCAVVFRRAPGQTRVWMEGFAITGINRLALESLGFTSIRLAGCIGSRVSGCAFTGVYAGLDVISGASDTIVGNQMNAPYAGVSRGEFIYVSGASHVVIANNFIQGPPGSSGWAGIYAYASSGMKVYYNTVRLVPSSDWACSVVRVENSGTLGHDFRNNLLILGAGTEDPTSACIRVDETTGDTLASDHNCFYVADVGTVACWNGVPLDFTDWQAMGFDPNGVNSDPMLVDSLDLHLQEGSPCIERGSPVLGFEVDVDGDPRDPVHPDIGADEYKDVGVAEPTPAQSHAKGSMASIAGEVRFAGELFDAVGRRASTVRPGVYFAYPTTGVLLVRKVLVTR